MDILSREALAIRVGFKLTGNDVIDVLDDMTAADFVVRQGSEKSTLLLCPVLSKGKEDASPNGTTL